MKAGIGIIIVASSVVCSCATNKRALILSGNSLVSAKTKIGYDSLSVFKTNCFIATVDVKDGYLFVKNIPDTSKDLQRLSYSVPNKILTGWQTEASQTVLFPEMEISRRFVYLDCKPVLQAFSIPLKIRPALDAPELLDSFPSQTETGFNPALALGWRFNCNIFKYNTDMFGKNLRQISITPGWFVGTGAVDLSAANTRTPVIEFARKAPLFSTGGFIMLGYNNIHFGYSFGWDYAQGKGSSSWLYRGKLWHGITIGLDIIK